MGARIKHRVKENWLKMYDKAGTVLRVEMVINNPEYFKVRKKVVRKNKEVIDKESAQSQLQLPSRSSLFLYPELRIHRRQPPPLNPTFDIKRCSMDY